MIKEFFTEKGIIIPAVTTAQMKEIDRIAVEETGPNLYQMMENAGRNLAGITMKVLGNNWREQNIIVTAGTGGNGGGGICAARHLANHGRNVKVCITEKNKLKKRTKLRETGFDYRCTYRVQLIRRTGRKSIGIN